MVATRHGTGRRTWFWNKCAWAAVRSDETCKDGQSKGKTSSTGQGRARQTDRQVQACTRPALQDKNHAGDQRPRQSQDHRAKPRDASMVKFREIQEELLPSPSPVAVASPVACAHLRQHKRNTLSNLSNRPWPVASSPGLHWNSSPGARDHSRVVGGAV